MSAERPPQLAASLIPLDQIQPQAHIVAMAIRKCKCGAAYERTEEITFHREIGNFQCLLCQHHLESWYSASVPQYRFVAGPAKVPTTDN